MRSPFFGKSSGECTGSFNNYFFRIDLRAARTMDFCLGTA